MLLSVVLATDVGGLPAPEDKENLSVLSLFLVSLTTIRQLIIIMLTTSRKDHYNSYRIYLDEMKQ